MDCAVLFADVAGSTALYERLGDTVAFGLIGSCLQAMTTCTVCTQGRVVKTIGDAVMSVFPGADDAADAALAMHRAVAALPTPQGVRAALRIGFHAGPVVEQGGDVFGDTVNLAARLCDQASRGQTVVARDTAARLHGRFADSLRPLYSVALKGKAEDVELVELAWEADADDAGDVRTLIAAPRAAAATALPELRMRLGNVELVLGRDRRKVSIGRDAGSDFVLPGRSASRSHATIERRREHFVLADHSANGSFVSLDGREEIRVHHEEITLVGHGHVAFGEPRALAPLVLEFGPAA